jgi:hypothetical protein
MNDIKENLSRKGYFRIAKKSLSINTLPQNIKTDNTGHLLLHFHHGLNSYEYTRAYSKMKNFLKISSKYSSEQKVSR